MTYRLKQLPEGTTVAAYLSQCGAEKYSMVGRGKASLDSTEYFATLAESRPGTITYYFAPDITKWEEILAKLRHVDASLLIVNNELSLILEPKPHQTILYCEHPKLLFARLVHSSVYQIGSKNVSGIGQNCQSGPNVQIEEGARFGENVVIEANCRIAGNVIIGNNVTIKANTVIGGQGFEFYKDTSGELCHFPHSGSVVIEDNVHIGSGVVIDAAVFGHTLIGHGTKVDNLTSIAHNVEIGPRCLVMANVAIAGSVKIGEDTRICLSASVRDGVAIGKNCVVGMNSCVTCNVSDGTTVYGVPAKVVSEKKAAQKSVAPVSADNLSRMARLIRETAIERLHLDLTGLTIVTEAATGPFAVTASIAAVAGAKVIAIGADSTYGSFETASQATLAVAKACKVADRIVVVRREQAHITSADIITNLGFVRPLDRQLIKQLKPGAVIPLMYDARELRPGEIELDACRERNINVFGTNEEHSCADVLSYSGPLAAKLLLESNIEIQRARIAIAGDNFFTKHIVQTLERFQADVTVISSWNQLTDECLMSLDALLFTDYWLELGACRDSAIVGRLKSASSATLIQFVGGVDVETFGCAGWRVTPSEPVAPHRMWKTLGYLGARPVIELHAAGLKVAEMEVRGNSVRAETAFEGMSQPIVTCQPVRVAYCCSPNC